MSSRSIATALIAVAVAGCGVPPDRGGAPQPTTAEKGSTAETNRSEQKRAIAGKEPSTVGPIKCEVVGWKTGKTERYVSGFSGATEPVHREYLSVELKFSTSDETASKHALGWLKGWPVLKDEFGNKLASADGGGSHFVGTTENRTVRAGNEVRDVWLFEVPLPSAKTLTLDFSAKCVELPVGEFRFAIPIK